jgi:hypothetical protein
MRVRIWKGPALALAMAAGIASTASAQSMEEKRDQKLKSAFLSKAAWNTDFAKACEESKKSGKAIFAYFTRSYSP